MDSVKNNDVALQQSDALQHSGRKVKAPIARLSAGQFDALQQLRGAHGDAAVSKAVRSVYVDGLKQSEAARINNVTPASLNNTVRACNRVLMLAAAAVL